MGTAAERGPRAKFRSQPAWTAGLRTPGAGRVFVVGLV
jgi:hypothetical protein